MSKNPLLKEVERLEAAKPIKKTEEYWHELGPGLTTGASDDDPSGIATGKRNNYRYSCPLSVTVNQKTSFVFTDTEHGHGI